MPVEIPTITGAVKKRWTEQHTERMSQEAVADLHRYGDDVTHI